MLFYRLFYNSLAVKIVWICMVHTHILPHILSLFRLACFQASISVSNIENMMSFFSTSSKNVRMILSYNCLQTTAKRICKRWTLFYLCLTQLWLRRQDLSSEGHRFDPWLLQFECQSVLCTLNLWPSLCECSEQVAPGMVAAAPAAWMCVGGRWGLERKASWGKCFINAEHLSFYTLSQFFLELGARNSLTFRCKYIH